ncbi:cation diffusion facilitator family transporter [Caldalkalibacillus thermarum TA2.A1]|uniref:Cation diffusion facilitator family transporter n=1 Tax=Caldalkalibacillus thermarum (strain TA2.A1) TaxID=986075 RepID=F5LAR4_CALTT|nr:cation diffusion facilitator family transporter [Caldalkalibacillus thermarum]EGL81636.1 cation diffusion facilitator family transporter [Caldalkalibacillus thermarum TA2.A1]QZT33479.1 cation diffusion facilitator family transporter [Caldalkalibacillus thermarum TA2.A1]GGK16220.1 cation transporter [Caldalkalibacillus thermarum]
MTTKQRFQQAEFAAWVGIVGNLFLAVLKAIVGTVGNSRALVADAVHSASDVIGSVAVLIGLKAAKLPPDSDHPYGHGKAESIAAIIVAVILFLAGLQIGYSSFQALFAPAVTPSVLAVFVALFSIVMKELMFQYKFRLGKKLNSDALITNAWEHRSDVLSSVAALIGIGGAVLGGYLGLPWLVYLDPLAGILVSLLVMRVAWKLGRESIHNTLDHVLHEEDALKLRKTVESVNGVIRVDELYAREHGHYVIVDVKIAVDPDLTVEEGHQIGKQVKDKLMKDHEHVQDVLVHVNPYREKPAFSSSFPKKP